MSILVPAHIGERKVFSMPTSVPGSGDHVDRGIGICDCVPSKGKLKLGIDSRYEEQG